MELKRSLGLFDAFAIGLGAIIGAGIFVVIGVAASLAGPALFLSIFIAGLVSAFTAASFVHLVRFIPREGGGYEYAHELVSPFAGFISGWMWLLSNIVTGSVVALGFASYLAVYIPLPVNLMAAFACLVITGINYMGARDSAYVNNLLVVFKLVILILFVVFGLSLINGAFFSPFAPNGAIGVMEGAAVSLLRFFRLRKDSDDERGGPRPHAYRAQGHNYCPNCFWNYLFTRWVGGHRNRRLRLIRGNELTIG